MPYKHIPGGYRYNQLLADGHQAAAKIRRLVEAAITTGDDLATLYMRIAAITLLTTRLDDVLHALADYDREDKSQ